MPYYVIPAVETPADENGQEPSIRPALPEGVTWGGVLHGDTYLLLTPVVLEGATMLDRTTVEAEALSRGLTLETVLQRRVGDYTGEEALNNG